MKRVKTWLALVLALCLLPLPARAAEQPAPLYFRWASYQSGSPEEQGKPSDGIYEDLGGRSHCTLYADADGQQPLSGQLTVIPADPAVVSVEETDTVSGRPVFCFRGRKVGETTVSVVSGGVTYQGRVQVSLPSQGFFATPEITEAGYLGYDVVRLPEDSRTFYYVMGRDTVEQVAPDPSGTEGLEIAVNTADPTHKSLKLTIREGWTREQLDGAWAGFERDTDRMTGDHPYMGFCLSCATPGVGLRYVYRPNGSYELSNHFERQVELAPDRGNPVVFRFGSGESNQPLAVTSVTSGDPGVIEVESRGEQLDGEPIWHLYGGHFGTTELTVTVSDGAVYTIPASVDLPQTGFYNAAKPSRDGLITPSRGSFPLSPDNPVFYVCTRKPDLSICELSFQGVPEGAVTIENITEPTAGRFVWEDRQGGTAVWDCLWDAYRQDPALPRAFTPVLKVTVDPKLMGNARVRVYMRSGSLHNTNGDGWGFRFEDSTPHLGAAWQWTDEQGRWYNDRPRFEDTLRMPLYEWRTLQLQLGSAGAFAPLTGIVSVNSADENVAAVTRLGEQNGLPVWRVEAVGRGTTALNVRTEQETFSMPVEIGLPWSGLYRSDRPSFETYLSQEELVCDLETDTVVWMLHNSPDGAWEGLTGVTQVDESGAPVPDPMIRTELVEGRIRVTVPRGSPDGLHCRLQLRFGSEWEMCNLWIRDQSYARPFAGGFTLRRCTDEAAQTFEPRVVTWLEQMYNTTALYGVYLGGRRVTDFTVTGGENLQAERLDSGLLRVTLGSDRDDGAVNCFHLSSGGSSGTFRRYIPHDYCWSFRDSGGTEYSVILGLIEPEGFCECGGFGSSLMEEGSGDLDRRTAAVSVMKHTADGWVEDTATADRILSHVQFGTAYNESGLLQLETCQGRTQEFYLQDRFGSAILRATADVTLGDTVRHLELQLYGMRTEMQLPVPEVEGSVRWTDAAGQPVTALPETGTLQAAYTVANPDPETETSADVWLAAYDGDGRLLQLQLVPHILAAGAAEELSAVLELPEGTARVCTSVMGVGGVPLHNADRLDSPGTGN